MPEAAPLLAAGWTATGSRQLYWKHERLYGEALFDVWDAAKIQDRRQPRQAKPARAPACRCPIPLVLNEDESCAKCARRLPG